MGETNRSFRIEDGGVPVEALLQKMGPDYLLSVWGGAAHIGAVAMAQPRPSLADPERLSATTSVFCYVGHKEGDLVKLAAERLATALAARVVVAAGLHWDHLTPAGIEQVQKNVAKLVGLIIHQIAPQNHTGPTPP